MLQIYGAVTIFLVVTFGLLRRFRDRSYRLSDSWVPFPFPFDNKLFWKTIKPFFSNKGSSGSNIKLVEKDEILQDDKKIAEELNTFFKDAVSTLDINKILVSLTKTFKILMIQLIEP